MDINPEKALFDLTMLNANVQDQTFDTESVKLLNLGLPPEVVTRLKEIWEKTKVIGNEVVAVGKIIVKKIVDFMLNNTGLTIGLVIGAALATLVSSAIPFIGPMLAPLVLTLTALYGYNLQEGGRDSLLYSAIKLAKAFFDLIISIFTAVASYVRE